MRDDLSAQLISNYTQTQAGVPSMHRYLAPERRVHHDGRSVATSHFCACQARRDAIIDKRRHVTESQTPALAALWRQQSRQPHITNDNTVRLCTTHARRIYRRRSRTSHPELAVKDANVNCPPRFCHVSKCHVFNATGGVDKKYRSEFTKIRHFKRIFLFFWGGA